MLIIASQVKLINITQIVKFITERVFIKLFTEHMFGNAKRANIFGRAFLMFFSMNILAAQKTKNIEVELVCAKCFLLYFGALFFFFFFELR